MSKLSQRGQALVDSPPLASYIREHFARFGEAWDSRTRPDGYIALCIAENKRRCDDLLSCLERYHHAPSHVLGYDAMIGKVEFRENLAAFMSRSFLGRTVTADNLAVLAGAGTVLELLFFAIADPGDGVLVPTPSYAGFWADLETRDALKIVRVDCRSDEGFALSPARLDEAVDAADCRVRALLFTNPDNPLGRLAPRQTLLEIIEWAEAREIHVVFDEVYALSVFGPDPFVSAASLRADLGEWVHIVWAFSKDFGASGLRCGVVVSENAAMLNAMDQLAYWAACSGHTQHLLSSFVADTEAVDSYVARMREDLRETYARVTAVLDDVGIPYIPAQAAFFLICDLRKFLDAPTFEAEQRLWSQLLDRANVNLTPGEACRIAEPGFFRLCYAGVEFAAVEIAIRRVAECLSGS
ncbi:MAG: aminotransferase class I/II-fold pyridoxal phosphate-dependent enzyme [Nannocystaceae bacterium]|nr:aminotransferase class I/II-fold pyridoxal phosphate-dependent enzyme [Nannocystaceae bacterium]